MDIEELLYRIPDPHDADLDLIEHPFLGEIVGQGFCQEGNIGGYGLKRIVDFVETFVNGVVGR